MFFFGCVSTLKQTRISQIAALETRILYNRSPRQGQVVLFTTTAPNPPTSHSIDRTKLIRFYRLLLYQCNDLQRFSHGNRFLIQPNITSHCEGLSCLVPNYEATTDDVLHSFRRSALGLQDPANAETDDSSESPAEITDQFPGSNLQAAMWCHPTQALKVAIREAFSSGSKPPGDYLLPAYQWIGSQLRLWQQTSVNVDQSLRVTAVAQAVSKLSPNSFRYGYRIRIENLHETEQVRLLGRSWRIHSGTRPPLNLNFPTSGCVGKFPFIDPGIAFEYQSAAEAQRESSMEGQLYLSSVERGKFSVAVPSFALHADGTI